MSETLLAVIGTIDRSAGHVQVSATEYAGRTRAVLTIYTREGKPRFELNLTPFQVQDLIDLLTQAQAVL
jgi:hypothetical protein